MENDLSILDENIEYNVTITSERAKTGTINPTRPEIKTETKKISGKDLVDYINQKDPYLIFQKSKVISTIKDGTLNIIKKIYGIEFLSFYRKEENIEITL